MLKVIEQNFITGETVERDQTAEEKAQAAKDLAEAEAQAEAEAERVAARQAVLDKLGLTANEAAALLG